MHKTKPNQTKGNRDWEEHVDLVNVDISLKNQFRESSY